MGATTYLVPALTVLMAWAILGQAPGWLALVGGTLCLAGVALSRRRPGTQSLPIWPRAELLAARPPRRCADRQVHHTSGEGVCRREDS
jgi:hypothetical protein